MKNVAVFYGGQSVEHDVSVITGVMTVNSIDKTKYNVYPVYVAKDGSAYTSEKLRDIDSYKNMDLKKHQRVTLSLGDNRLYKIKGNKLKPICSISIGVNCMHGGWGEEGGLSAFLEGCSIAVASPGLLPSAISMDKAFTKTVMKGLNVKTLDYVVAKRGELELIKLPFDFPVIIKPNLLGSSIGVSVANDEESLIAGIKKATRYGEKVLIEPFIQDFIEINCAVYSDGDGKVCVSECERPIGSSEYLSFSDKYKKGKREFPANIDQKISEKIKGITKKVYEKMNFTGVIRIDYFVKGKDVYLNEINSVPGSLAFYLFGQTMKDFSKMLNEILDRAEREYVKKASEVRDFDSGILTGVGAKGSKRL